eukprot:gnl/Chilomastix_cuspidata/1877.p1 GENE.gnl/Chilomastix_cuspidata/1877~~gnl/Chilomastix_cuspidata/1877.p1  ORF type:complete len:1581 (-),score=332.81 gnl/Chilomastix_cuspidata/1877:400-5019(-)
MNSLLQVLFMTPEFRDLIFRFRYNEERDGPKRGCIPYQLQKLFAHLAVSEGINADTEKLTHSFGWDQLDSHVQHDVQELNRVLFDALLRTFVDTSDRDIIYRLYQGRENMITQCQSCGCRSERAQDFMDLSLPLRPTLAASIEELLTPETLDGSNQYFCQICGQRQNAFRGRQFTEFPPIISFHLQRFQFSAANRQAVKRNDFLSFPLQLDVSGFLDSFSGVTAPQPPSFPPAPPQPPQNLHTTFDVEMITSIITSMYFPSVESGGPITPPAPPPPPAQPPLPPPQPRANQPPAENANAAEQQQNQPPFTPHFDHSNMSEGFSDQFSPEQSENNFTTPIPPHDPLDDVPVEFADLFATAPDTPTSYKLSGICVHSGSANGGHYYALVRDLETDRWYKFNDTSVSAASYSDIVKVFGTPPGAAGEGSDGESAYLLVYRHTDLGRHYPPVERLPKKLIRRIKLQNLKDREEKAMAGHGRKVCCRIFTNINAGLVSEALYGPGIVKPIGASSGQMDIRSLLHILPNNLTVSNPPLFMHKPFELMLPISAPISTLADDITFGVCRSLGLERDQVRSLGDPVILFKVPKLRPGNDFCDETTISTTYHSLKDSLSSIASKKFFNSDDFSLVIKTCSIYLVFPYRKIFPQRRLVEYPVVDERDAWKTLLPVIFLEKEKVKELGIFPELLSFASGLINQKCKRERERIIITEPPSLFPSESDAFSDTSFHCITPDIERQNDLAGSDLHFDTTIQDLSDGTAIQSSLFGLVIPPIIVPERASYDSFRQLELPFILDSIARSTILSRQIYRALSQTGFDFLQGRGNSDTHWLYSDPYSTHTVEKVLIEFCFKDPKLAQERKKLKEELKATVLPPPERLGLFKLCDHGMGKMHLPYVEWRDKRKELPAFFAGSDALSRKEKEFQDHLRMYPVGHYMRRKKPSPFEEEVPDMKTIGLLYGDSKNFHVVQIAPVAAPLELMSPHITQEDKASDALSDEFASVPAVDSDEFSILLKEHSNMSNIKKLYITSPHEHFPCFSLNFDMRKTVADLANKLIFYIPGIDAKEMRMRVGYSERLNPLPDASKKKKKMIEPPSEEIIRRTEVTPYSTLRPDEKLSETNLSRYKIKVVCIEGGLAPKHGHQIVSIFVHHQTSIVNPEIKSVYDNLVANGFIVTPGLDTFDTFRLAQCYIRDRASYKEVLKTCLSTVRTAAGMLHIPEHQLRILLKIIGLAEDVSQRHRLRIRHFSSLLGLKKPELAGSYWQPIAPNSMPQYGTHVPNFYYSKGRKLILEVLEPETAEMVRKIDSVKLLKSPRERFACVWVTEPSNLLSHLSEFLKVVKSTWKDNAQAQHPSKKSPHFHFQKVHTLLKDFRSLSVHVQQDMGMELLQTLLIDAFRGVVRPRTDADEPLFMEAVFHGKIPQFNRLMVREHISNEGPVCDVWPSPVVQSPSVRSRDLFSVTQSHTSFAIVGRRLESRDSSCFLTVMLASQLSEYNKISSSFSRLVQQNRYNQMTTTSKGKRPSTKETRPRTTITIETNADRAAAGKTLDSLEGF